MPLLPTSVLISPPFCPMSGLNCPAPRKANPLDLPSLTRGRCSSRSYLPLRSVFPLTESLHLLRSPLDHRLESLASPLSSPDSAALCTTAHHSSSMFSLHWASGIPASPWFPSFLPTSLASFTSSAGTSTPSPRACPRAPSWFSLHVPLQLLTP